MAAAFAQRHLASRSCQLWSLAKFSSQSRPDEMTDRIIRVDHAGEYGADRIYAGQLAVLQSTSIGPTIHHMWDQERDHLKVFSKLMVDRRVRPTVLLPIWNVAGYALGVGSALIGKEAAMACTVAVESVIVEHYNNQLRELLHCQPKDSELMEVIKKCRDDEEEHHDKGLEYDAEQTPNYWLFTSIIKVGCYGAIWLSERI
ncbi:5-demethoxyubiquinone hydroxylase, mitochondrial-like isoform X2 [Dysidea avara]|uniref:5-demethoxyubiquinone hydroxylase, mitochondrial-like isoform X2 n=1 Tax=Dysidea avara TaxID=196820 RepID=UPI003330DD63